MSNKFSDEAIFPEAETALVEAEREIEAAAKKLSVLFAPGVRRYALDAAWNIATRLVTGSSKTRLVAHVQLASSLERRAQFRTAIEACIAGDMPVGYLLESTPFLDLQILCRPPILIPRVETEYWVDQLIHTLLSAQLSDQFRILDLCTGSGCIALALAHRYPEATVVGTDLNPAAVQLAEENRARHHLTNVSFLHSDLFSALAGQQFDLIVSNPPYLSEREWHQEIDRSVRDWEDRRALVAPEEGLWFYRQLVTQAVAYLKPATGNWPQLVMEIGYRQGAAVTALLHDAGWQEIVCHKDLSGNDRWIHARRTAATS